MRFFFAVILLAGMCVGISCSRNKADKHEQSAGRAVIHYMSWTAQTLRQMTCDDLRRGSDSVVVSDSAGVARLVQALDSAKLTLRPEFRDIDVRVCCVIFGPKDSVIHELGFELPPLMTIDGDVYDRDQKLLDVVSSYLPKGYRNAATFERIRVAEDADYQADFQTALLVGDLRFMGVMQYSLQVPGVSNYDSLYSKSHGVKVIEGSTDDLTDSVTVRRNVFYNAYATGYNSLLLEMLGDSSKDTVVQDTESIN